MIIYLTKNKFEQRKEVDKAEVKYENEMINCRSESFLRHFYLCGDYCIIKMISSLDIAHLGNSLMRKKMMSELKMI